MHLVLLSLLALASTPLVVSQTGTVEEISLCNSILCPQVLCPPYECQSVPEGQCCPQCGPKACPDCRLVKCAQVLCPAGTCKNPNKCCGTIEDCSANFCKPQIDCSTVLCAAPPETCPKGQCLGTPKGQCCPQCSADLCPDCTNVLCPAVVCPPGTCKDPSDCCVNPSKCSAKFCKPPVDCSLVRCAAPPETCPKGQCLGTPKGQCCPQCSADLCPDCTNVLCPAVVCPSGTCKHPGDCCVNPRRCRARFC